MQLLIPVPDGRVGRLELFDHLHPVVGADLLAELLPLDQLLGAHLHDRKYKQHILHLSPVNLNSKKAVENMEGHKWQVIL